MTSSVEYSHIYSDAQFGPEQIGSIMELKKVEGKNVKKLIMIDDYTPIDGLKNFNLSEFLKNLEGYGATPDVIIKESSLTVYCDQVVALLSAGKVKKGLEKYIDNKDKYPCSLFIATWYLLRLGYLGRNGIETILGDKEDVYCEKITTILPKRYIAAEDNGLEIIDAIPSVNVKGKISHIYF